MSRYAYRLASPDGNRIWFGPAEYPRSLAAARALYDDALLCLGYRDTRYGSYGQSSYMEWNGRLERTRWPVTNDSAWEEVK